MPANILVVDDHRTFRESFCTLLTICFTPIQIVAVEDAASALRLLQQRPFDVLITDYQLKALSGTLLIRQIKQHTASTGTPLIPMVLMSSNPDIGVFARALGVPFLPKPIDPETCTTVLGPLLPRASRPDWPHPSVVAAGESSNRRR